jgi:hypothetical protein
MLRNVSSLLFCLVCLVPLSPERVMAVASTPPDFTGVWTLSVESQAQLQAPRTEGARPGGGRGGERSGGKGGGGRGGGRRGGSRPEAEHGPTAQDSPRRAQILQELSRLEIFHDGVELNVTNGLDISRLLYTDGRTLTIWTQQGETTATANWQDQTLVVRWGSPRGSSERLRRYVLSPDGHQLTVTEERGASEGGKSQEMKLVYVKQE